MKNKIILFAVGAFFLFAFPAQASRLKDGDFGVWLRTDFEKKLNSKWKVAIGENLRFREHQGLYYAETRAGGAYQPWKNLVLGADYSQVRNTREKGKKDIWYWESRLHFYVTPQMTVKGWKIEDKNAIDLRAKESARDSLRYRNMITITAPWKWTRFEIQPYVSDGLYFESHRRGLVENRLYTGVKTRLSESVHATFYYLRDSVKDSAGGWRDVNIAGTAIKFVL